MATTSIEISGTDFLINGRKTYSEVPSSPPDIHGLLFNARFINAIFDDSANPSRFARFGWDRWDPERHTSEFIEALPEWYRYGLRAFTVGFQGGIPGHQIDNKTVVNNPFGTDGKRLDPAYADRMDRVIRAADRLGMAAIVSFLYGAQTRHFTALHAIENAVITASRFVKDGGYRNVLIEVANEMDHSSYGNHTLVTTPEGMASLIGLARRESGGMPVGCSGTGGYINETVAHASDYILFHANDCSRQRYLNCIQQLQSWCPDRPIVCNEDSQALGQLAVARRTHTSWGYMSVPSKQSPPAQWGVVAGEDEFFARRVAEMVGIATAPLAFDNQFYLQGLEPHAEYLGARYIRVAALYPERIDHVDFFVNGEQVFTCYDEPFALFFEANFTQREWVMRPGDREFRARIHLCDGTVVTRSVEVGPGQAR